MVNSLLIQLLLLLLFLRPNQYLLQLCNLRMNLIIVRLQISRKCCQVKRHGLISHNLGGVLFLIGRLPYLINAITGDKLGLKIFIVLLVLAAICCFVASNGLWLRCTDLDARGWVEALRSWLNLTVSFCSGRRTFSLIATFLLTARRTVRILIRGVLLRRRRLLLLLVRALL